MTKNPHAKGFTLMESVIAIGIVAILLTTFLAVFGPATQGIKRAISVQEADRLASALERELQMLRPQTDDGYNTSFEKAFVWLIETGSQGNVVLLYNYKGDPNNTRPDGTLEPYDQAGGEPGRDFVLQPAVRRADDPSLQDDLDAVVGPAYYVAATQLVFNNGELTLGSPGEIADPHNTGNKFNKDQSDSFPEAVIAYNAQIYALKSNNYQYIQNFDPTDDDQLGQPLFSRNLAVRR